MEENELQELLIDTQKEYTRSNKFKDKMIVLLIVLMFLEAAVGYCGFVWYESQFDYVTTEQTTETKSVDVGTNGDNANAEYNDVNDNVLPKFVKSAMTQYKEWEERTKQLYEEVWQECINYGMTADAEYISDLVEDVTKEIKKVNRMCEQLNGTGYDSVAIHNMQDKYHEKYKKKYNEEYTDKEVRKLKEQNKHK